MENNESHLIINKYIKPDSIPRFIRISNDDIINTAHIVLIRREWSDSYTYNAYIEQYNNLMESATDEYLKKHPEYLLDDDDETKIVDEMYKKFDPIIKKQLKDDFGKIPEPWDASYKIKLVDGTEFFISESIYYQILNVIGIDIIDEMPLD